MSDIIAPASQALIFSAFITLATTAETETQAAFGFCLAAFYGMFSVQLGIQRLRK